MLAQGLEISQCSGTESMSDWRRILRTEYIKWVMSKLFSLGGSTTDSVPAGRSGEAGGALSSIAAERMVGSRRDQAHSMRQSTSTTMACVTCAKAPARRWHASRGATCHVARATCRRVNTYENKRWGKIFEWEVAETPNLQGTCALVWHTYHVSDYLKGSKHCPQGAILFFSLMPCSSDTLGPRVTKFGTQVEANKGYPSL